VLVVPGRLSRQKALAGGGDEGLPGVGQDGVGECVGAVEQHSHSDLVGAALDAQSHHSTSAWYREGRKEIETETEKDRERERQRERQRDRERQRERERERQRERDRERETERERHRDIETYKETDRARQKTGSGKLVYWWQ
jgi:hypothetical protein